MCICQFRSFIGRVSFDLLPLYVCRGFLDEGHCSWQEKVDIGLAIYCGELKSPLGEVWCCFGLQDKLSLLRHQEIIGL